MTGLLLSIMLGTVFFCLVQNSIENGFRSGAFVAIGVIISDILMILVSNLNASLIPAGGTTETVVRVCGAVLLVVMAIGNLRKRKAVVFPGASGKRPLVLASRGFMLNLLNPANYLSWLGLTATLNNVLHYTTQQQFAFYTGALAGIFGMEMLISLGATWLKRYISPLFLRRLDVAVGIVFLVFAVLLVKPLFSGK
jgi:threonine/homoserine/homoserine lactone efflux protein